jgi:hypothetical protein
MNYQLFMKPKLQKEACQALGAYRWESLQVLLGTAELQTKTRKEIVQVSYYLGQYIYRELLDTYPIYEYS